MIYLKGARPKDRKKVYKWLYHSDFSPFLNKLTGYSPETIHTFQDFKDDYEDFFFNDSSPEKGRAYLIILNENNEEETIGFISYTGFGLVEGTAELDIWLKSLNYAGKRYGTTALKILSNELLKKRFHTLIIRPCKKNVRAIKSYEKTGFRKSIFEPEKYYKQEFIEEYAPGDCKDGDTFMIFKK